MNKYVTWRILSVKLVQSVVLVGAIVLVWFATSQVLNAVLGDLTNADGRAFDMQYSQTLAFVLIVMAAVVVWLVQLAQKATQRVNAMMNFWALRR